MAIVNLIPMAGEGQRFKNEGYKLPKPLIEIDGVPMVIKALKSLPLADKNILIVRKGQFNITNSKIKKQSTHEWDKNKFKLFKSI